MASLRILEQEKRLTRFQRLCTAFLQRQPDVWQHNLLVLSVVLRCYVKAKRFELFV